MPEKNVMNPSGESSITKEKPIEDTFAAIPDPDEIYAVMREIEAVTIPEMLGLDGTAAEEESFDEADCDTTDTPEPEIEGQIALTSIPVIEKEDLADTSDTDYGNAYEQPAVTVEEDAVPAPEQLTISIGDEQPEAREEKKDKGYDSKKPRKIDSVFEFVELLIFTFLTVMVVSSFFFRHSEVIGSSMENTLHDGDHLIISDLFYTPARGDIIVCSDYSTGLKSPIVKRVIGIADDTVKIDKDGNVMLNGEILDEPYVYINSAFPAYRDGEWVVPEGEVFVMGDHRNVSEDSRSFGTVKVDSILGKVLLRFYPFDKFDVVN